MDGKTPVELAEGAARLALLGEYRKDELLEAARSGNEEKLISLLIPQNVNCHAGDGRKSTPLHLAAGYNRYTIQIDHFCLPYFSVVHSISKPH